MLRICLGLLGMDLEMVIWVFDFFCEVLVLVRYSLVLVIYFNFIDMSIIMVDDDIGVLSNNKRLY